MTTTNQTGQRTAGAWLAAASLLLVLALAFHGPLHPDLQMQMTRIAGSASRWAVVHWIAAAAFSCFAVAAILVLVSGSRLTVTGKMMSAWAVVLVGSLWTLTTAVTEVAVIPRLATSGDIPQFEAWWSFAEGNANGFSLLAVAVAVIAWNEITDPHRRVPKWSAAVGVGAGLASFAGWALGVWFDIGPANVLWVLASAVMCIWLASLGIVLARTSEPVFSGER
jgi:hypothetical protein